jgi:pyrroline-5-carboxylate reductase
VNAKNIALIGFGNMGQALARGWLANGHAPDAIRIVDPEERAREAAADLGLRASAAIADYDDVEIVAPDVVVLAVKPKQLEDATANLRALRRSSPNAVYLSIMAGTTIWRIQNALGAPAGVVRAMPNMPAAIGRGMTVLTASSAVTPAQRSLCGELLGAVGSVAWIDDEASMDAVTAVSGSGPAYVFLLIECLELAAIESGLAVELAKELAIKTVGGAAAYAEGADQPPTELRRRVTSPSGTTEAALEILNDEHGMRDLISRAVRAATARSRELSAT